MMPDDATRTVGPTAAATSPSAPPDEPAGPVPGPPGYELLEEVGRGGMGIVYRARDEALGRDVAVKVLADRYGPASPAAQRFRAEARITGQLQHPGIPAVHLAADLPDGRPFLAMKLIKGKTLEALLRARADAAEDRSRFVAVFEDICQALGYAHSHDVIHRDLKPANVMVGAFGEVQVMDWGLAKLLGVKAAAGPDQDAIDATWAYTQIDPTPEGGSHTEAGSLMGTPAFAPPEQVAGEIDRMGVRADVFGLGAILAVILTGRPPYVGETAESVRVMAVRGKLDGCFARLDACGAEPELVELCKRCLAFEPSDRPADAAAVAEAVAGLRAAAEDRARAAELETVRVEGEQKAAEARSAERRRRRRVWLGAASLLALAVVGGLAAVVVVQRRANAALAAEQAKVQARFDTAMHAIETFHTGVSEDALLNNPEFTELRKKLLKEAAGFYAELERLLAGQTDARSRRTLAEGYFQLGELTAKFGDAKEATRVHRKALALRRELAAEPGADVETRLDVARSLFKTGRQVYFAGDLTGGLRLFEEQRDIAARLEAIDPSHAARFLRALGLARIGIVLDEMWKTTEALEAYREASAVLQELADADPGNTDYLAELALIHSNTAILYTLKGRPAEALESQRKALPIRRKLVDADPANTDFRYRLGESLKILGGTLEDLGKLQESREAFREALEIVQKLAHDQPAVALVQLLLAMLYDNRGTLVARMGKPEEALEVYGKALAILQRLVDGDPTNIRFKPAFADVQENIGLALNRQKRFAEALTATEAALAIRVKLMEEDPGNNDHLDTIAASYGCRGMVRIGAGRPAEAAADLRHALELMVKVPPRRPWNRYWRSQILSVLDGLGADARSGVTKAEAAAFADQAVAGLAEVVKTGWVLPGDLKEPEFDAVRDRPDFRKLVAEVEARAEKVPEPAPLPREPK